MFHAKPQVTNAPHKAELSHELIAAAASYEAAKAYEKHVAANGKPDNHAQAKEILYVAQSTSSWVYELTFNFPSAGFAGAFVDRMVETKGLDFVDKEEAKYKAHKQLEEQSAQDF